MKLRLQIFDLLINHDFFSHQVSKKLSISKQIVHLHVKAMRKDRIIELAIPESHESYLKTVCNEGKHRPAVNIRSGKFKSYKRGPNASEYDEMIRTGKIHTEPPQIRVHHTQYKMRLVKRYKNAKEISDKWKVVHVNDYLYNKYCEIPFKGYGDIGIRWSVSHKKKGPITETIVVTLPPKIKYFMGEYGNLERGIKAFDIQKWFGRNGYQLSLPEEIKETHYGIDTGIESERFGVIPIDKDTYLDSSPGATYEVESKKPEIANTLAELPARLASMDNTLADISKGIVTLTETINEDQRISNNRLSGLNYYIKERSTEQNNILSDGFSNIVGAIENLDISIKKTNKQYEETQEQVKESTEYKSKDGGPDAGYQ